LHSTKFAGSAGTPGVSLKYGTATPMGTMLASAESCAARLATSACDVASCKACASMSALRAMNYARKGGAMAGNWPYDRFTGDNARSHHDSGSSGNDAPSDVGGDYSSSGGDVGRSDFGGGGDVGGGDFGGGGGGDV
jgi:hypothetical protein